ncbi:hypothetical protein [Novosphingobium sp. ST904]|uniref:hypothetical protein n=1 Tax=Novosphingobium sp. ST904 TaxID=1684385 RepID=UPI0006C88E65|nr:hypothetical protein [Novosphingobium sp. ST904]KPH66885.1 hypothetical protein ADT71_03775 [Novosphingobium sp. ST904]TCM39126.1 hypothetical protein EDF59_1065 [Novosphingobium sp. ST904]
MTRTSTGPRPVFSASNVRDEIANALQSIKDANGYTDEDLGRVLGKSEDMAAAYRKGTSGMDAFSLLAAWREWNGPFIGPIRRFVEGSRPVDSCDFAAQSAILKAALALAVALEDGDIDYEEVRDSRADLERARDAIDAQLSKLVRAA